MVRRSFRCRLCPSWTTPRSFGSTKASSGPKCCKAARAWCCPTATITHTLDNGSIMFFARDLNDKNLFITDIPVTVTGTGSSQSVSAFPGFNPNTGTFAGSGLRGISVQETPTGPPLTADLSKGRGASLHMFGSDLDLNLSDGISLSNKLMYSAGEVDCYCLFNNLPPQTLSSFISGQMAAVNANTAITGPYGLATSGTATLVGTGAAVNPTPTWPRWASGSCKNKSNPLPTTCASRSICSKA